MKKHIKEFCLRGMAFGGFGPLVYGIVMLIIYLCGDNTAIDGLIIFKGVLSTYLLGFICAGVSIVWNIDKLGIGFAILIHGSALYISYLLTYLINGWLGNNNGILIFSIVFILGYVLVWLVIYIIEKCKAKKLTRNLK